MENYPHLPLAQVRTTQAADYMSLLTAEAGAPGQAVFARMTGLQPLAREQT